MYLGLKISSRNKLQKCGVWYDIRNGEVRYGEGSLYSQVLVSEALSSVDKERHQAM
jgi:hypothetical protein